MRNKPHKYVRIRWEVSRTAVLVSGSNTIGCPNNIVPTAAVVSQNVWPTQILAVLEMSAVVGFVIGGRAPFCSRFCAVLSSSLPSLIVGFHISSFLPLSFFLFCLLLRVLCLSLHGILCSCIAVCCCISESLTNERSVQQYKDDNRRFLHTCVWSGTGQYDCWHETGGTCSSWTDVVCSRPSYPKGGSVPLRVVEEVREVPAKPRGRRFFSYSFLFISFSICVLQIIGAAESGVGPR